MAREQMVYVALMLASECEATGKRAMLLGARLRQMAIRPTIEILEDDLMATMQAELTTLEAHRLTQEGYAVLLQEAFDGLTRQS